jgi:hypothetical protein
LTFPDYRAALQSEIAQPPDLQVALGRSARGRHDGHNARQAGAPDKSVFHRIYHQRLL